MTTLHCLSPKNKMGSKPSLLAMDSKHLHFRLKHYGSPNKFITVDAQSKGIEQHNRQIQSSQLVPDNEQPHNKCLYYYRPLNHNDSSHPIRNNLRIHLLKRESRSNTPKSNNQNNPPSNYSNNSKNTSKDGHSSKDSSISRVLSIQRRKGLIQLPNIKKNQPQGNISHKQLPTHDVSFELNLSKLIENETKLTLPPKIWSQNLLGEGLKKHSTSKLKILVKNPFERHLRHHESQMQQIKQTEFQSTTREQSIPHVPQNFISTSRDQLTQLVSMI